MTASAELLVNLLPFYAAIWPHLHVVSQGVRVDRGEYVVKEIAKATQPTVTIFQAKAAHAPHKKQTDSGANPDHFSLILV